MSSYESPGTRNSMGAIIVRRSAVLAAKAKSDPGGHSPERMPRRIKRGGGAGSLCMVWWDFVPATHRHNPATGGGRWETKGTACAQKSPHAVIVRRERIQPEGIAQRIKRQNKEEEKKKERKAARWWRAGGSRGPPPPRSLSAPVSLRRARCHARARRRRTISVRPFSCGNGVCREPWGLPRPCRCSAFGGPVRRSSWKSWGDAMAKGHGARTRRAQFAFGTWLGSEPGRNRPCTPVLRAEYRN